MQEKKAPFKVISIVLFAVAAVFIALAVVIGVKYKVTPQSVNTKVVNPGDEDILSSDEEDSYVEATFDNFTVTKDGAAAAASSDASGAAEEGAATGENTDESADSE